MAGQGEEVLRVAPDVAGCAGPMKLLRTLLSLLLLWGICTPVLAIERSLQKRFPVAPGATLKVETYRGGILIEDSDTAEIRVDVRMELATENEAEADGYLKKLELDLFAEGDAVTVRAHNASQTGAHFSWNDKQRIELTFRIRVPRACNLNVATLDGSITIGHIAGRVAARTRTGTISCRNIEGSVEATVDAGDIVVSRCTGAADLNVTRGTIRAGTIFGAAKLRSARGDIEIQNARGDLLARTAGGDVQAGFAKQFQGVADVATDGGNVYVALDPQARCDILASSVWGQVQVVLPSATPAGDNTKRRFAGQLNGGGPRITLRASGGNVRIEASKQFIE